MYSIAGGIICIRHSTVSLLGVRIHAPLHLLTYLLTQNNHCFWRLVCDLVS